MAVRLVELPERGSVAGLGSPNESSIRTCPTSHGSHPNCRGHAMLCHLCLVFRHANGRPVPLTHPLGGAVWYHSRVETEPLVVLGIVDALLVAMFFLFRVLPWARPGPWRLLWLVPGLTSVLFIPAELVSLSTQGTALVPRSGGEADRPARVGGDEVALLLPGADPAIAQGIAEHVLAGLANGMAPERRVGAAIGIVPDAQRFTTTEAVRKADTAMYASKTAGGSRITVASS